MPYLTPESCARMEIDLADPAEPYRPQDRRKRVESERFRRVGYHELASCEAANLDTVWRRDESLDDASILPVLGVLAAETIEELEVTQFAELAASLLIERSEGGSET